MADDILAYVFWHWSRPGVAPHEYEGRQRAFHTALAAAPADGYRESLSVALTGAQWAADGGAAYEDWYLVRDFGALGALNAAAMTASRAAAHDAAAAVAGGGAGGLYRLKRGSVMRRPAVAHWFSKPEGMAYRELFDRLAPIVDESRGALWMRQMVLGPAREFCLHAASTVTLADPIEPLVLSLRTVWPEGEG